MSEKVEIEIVQFNAIVGDINGNTNRILDIISNNRSLNCTKLFVFPELALCGYSPEDLLFRQDFSKSIEDALETLKNNIGNSEYLVLGAPSYEDNYTKIYNSAYIFNNKKILNIYKKQVLPNYGVFDEKRYFEVGNENCVINIGSNKIGIMICEDLWNFNSVKDRQLEGIDFLISINASPYEINKGCERIELFKEVVSKNKFNLIYLNTVGGQDEIVFDGNSFLLDRNGSVKNICKSFSEEVFSFSIDKKEFCETDKETKYNNIYKKDEYEDLYEALKIGTYDYISKSNLNGVLLGLSGGIDSALTLAIASDIFDKKSIEAILLPSVFTSDLSIQLAKEQCKLLDINYSLISIEDVNNSINNSLMSRFDGFSKDVTEENIQARARGLLLMSISNKTGNILLTTGNKSELAVGYSTLYGDMSGSFAPLKDIYKTDVFGLSKYRNTLTKVIPQEVIDRMPTAELSPNQYDIDTLPPYDVLDVILKSFIEEKKSLEQICQIGYEKNLVANIINMVIRNEYKRRQYAPGIKVSSKSFGRDRRFPIVSRFKY
ncbi:MAG: NAD+ synthase [Gammaproteobacteria bacterium]|tara:strand:+ start:1173 stop:2813 length:1641 start_codon:yes stop_codon:yes gene_type:complete